jgi:nicotinamide-nucleotide amidase
LVRRANQVVVLLKRKKLTIVTAESCTAGLISAALSQADGASDVLEGAFVTYTKQHKSKALGVRMDQLKHAGAVTPAVAARMADGALKRSRARIALSVTGVLGPMPDEDGNPVGLIYLAFARKGRSPHVVEKRFPRASHDQLRSLTVMTAFEIIEECVRK